MCSLLWNTVDNLVITICDHCCLVWFILRPCQHDDGYIDGRSQIKVHADERTQVHSARSSLTVTHPSTNRGRNVASLQWTCHWASLGHHRCETLAYVNNVVRWYCQTKTMFYGNISCELFTCGKLHSLCISDITCVQNSHVFVSENTHFTCHIILCCTVLMRFCTLFPHDRVTKMANM